MLKDLTMSNYRGFSRMALREASRVNLIVGRNNSGKTSVLEAIRLLASKRDIYGLIEVAADRGEVLPSDDWRTHVGRGLVVDISHFFHGHGFEPGQVFKIDTDNGMGGYGIEIIDVGSDELGEVEIVPQQRDESVDEGLFDYPSLAVRVLGADGQPSDRPVQAYSVADNGAFNPYLSPRMRMRSDSQRGRNGPGGRVVSISSASLDEASMATMWAQQVRAGKEQGAVDALKILDERIREIFFLANEGSTRALTTGILVGLEDNPSRVPLGSMGDGMRRLLALSLAVSAARNGFLLVDEIDTGLHWTAMADMWALVINAATENNVQVFATTHSLDCLRGLAEAASRETLFPGGFSAAVFRVERDLPEAIRYGEQELQYAVDQDTEVRGR